MTNNPTYYSISLLSAPKIHTDLLWDLTMVFIGVAVIFFISIFFFRNKISARSRRTLEKKRELSPMISEFIFYTEEGSKEEKSTYINHKIYIRELLNDKFDREVLASTLLELKKDVSGQAQKQLIDLYKNLGLHLDAYEKLKSWRWEVVAKGILELTQMQVTESYQIIVRYINDKRSTVRRQAEISTITLRNEGISYFLDTTKYKITEWQQLSLLEILRNNDDFEPPQFKAWLTSKNKHVVLFALRLIKHYSQNDARTALIELVKHRNDQIKLEAIECLKVFNVEEATDTLKLVFWRCSTEVKISILGAISELGNTGDITFLKQIENKRLDFTVKSKAISAINTISPESIMPTKGIEKVTGIIIPEDIIENNAVEESNDENQIVPQEETIGNIYEEELNSLPLEDETEIQIKETEENLEEIEVEIDQQELEFLPLVSTESERDEQDDLENIEVISDEIKVSSTDSDKTQEYDCPEFDLTDDTLNFLPVVVPKESEEEMQQDITDFDVVYDELEAINEYKEEINLDNTPEFEFTENDLTFLPIVVQEDVENNMVNDEELFDKTPKEFKIDHGETTIEEEKTVIDEILENNLVEEQKRFEEISNLEVVYDELNSEESLLDEDNEFIDWSASQNDEPEVDGPIVETEIESIISLIPKPFKFDDETTMLIRLLSDIEELGDYREIPFLTELLLEESRPLIRERIQDVIYGIEKKIDIENESERQSVFEVLFKTSDKESKLILMDEMVTVGDEKEIFFLTQLLDDPNIEISTKAESTLTLLEERLSDESLKEMNSASYDLSESCEFSLIVEDEDDDLLTFTDEFVLESSGSLSINKLLHPFDANPDSGFLSQLKSIPNKLFEKLNG